MGTGRPDGDSSSPNDNRIVRVRPEGAAGEVVHVDLSDGSSFCLPAEKAASRRLAEGLWLSAVERARLFSLSRIFEARRKAVELLALREQSRLRLRLKLLSRGFDAQSVAKALDELEANGAVDDLRFARLWIMARDRRNPSGRKKLYAGLLQQGVSRRTAETALGDWDDKAEERALRRAADRVRAQGRMTDAKAMRALVGKGFSLPAVRRILELPEEDF